MSPLLASMMEKDSCVSTREPLQVASGKIPLYPRLGLVKDQISGLVGSDLRGDAHFPIRKCNDHRDDMSHLGQLDVKTRSR